MRFKNSLLLFTTFFSNIFYVVFANDGISFEHVYIDVLIYNYMSMEKSLWDEINASETKPNENLVAKIRNQHNEFFSSETVSSIMSDELKLKFKKYLNVSVLDSYVREDQNAKSNISNVILSDYNSTLTNDLFEQIKKDTESLSCDIRSNQVMESSSHNLFMFYQLFISLMLVSYATEQRRNMMQYAKNGIEGYDYRILMNKFNTLYERIGHLARNQMTEASRDIWMCDLDFYRKDDESIQVTNLLQGYVENEVNLNKEGSCAGSCDDYKFARNHHCADGTFCGEERNNGTKNAFCTGQIVDCTFVESDMKICPSLEGNPRRRYDHIKYKSGRHMGREFCGRERYPVESFLTLWLSYCSYCFCYCDDDTEQSDRYFSLKPAISDISQNKIITGVGLSKRNGVFSWSITQSTLRSNGRVDQLQQNQTNGETNDDEIYQDFNRTNLGTEGVDYHKLSWQNRSINLATTLLPPGSVVIGIRFTVIKEHLNFEILSSQFNFNMGQLYGRNEWISNKNEKRSVLLLDQPAPSHPIYKDSKFGVRSIPNFETNKFIKFRPSDPDKDAGQTTVPFVDTQMVRPKELTLISGVSLYYKGRRGYGRFIAPKLIVYDMSSYLTNN